MNLIDNKGVQIILIAMAWYVLECMFHVPDIKLAYKLLYGLAGLLGALVIFQEEE